MHDITDLEGRGIPSVFVASAEFVNAATSQSEALGFRPAAIFLPHPIQDRTDDEMRALAAAAVDPILSQITAESAVQNTE